MTTRGWRHHPLIRAAAWLLTLAVLGVVLATLARRTVAVVDAGLPPWWAVVAAIGIYAASNAVLVQGWRMLVALTGPRPSFPTAGWIWSASQFSRYVFSLAQVPSRVALAQGHGVPAGPTLLAGLLELALLLVPVSTVVLLTAPWWLPGGEQVRWLAAVAVVPVLAVTAALASPPSVWRVVRAAAGTRLGQRLGPEGADTLARSEPPGRGRAARLVGTYAVNHLLRLGAFLAVFLGTAGALPVADVVQAIGAAALGTLAGTVAVFAPGGLGVREATAALGLTPIVGAGAAIGITVGIRFLELVAELATLLGFRLARRAGVAPPR